MLCGDPGVPIHGPSGASAHLRGIARGLQDLGHEVLLAALLAHDARGRHDVPLGVPSVTVGRPRWPEGLRTFGEWVDGRRLARRARAPFDLVYERYSLRCDGGLRLARRLGVPHVLEVNAPLSVDRGRRGLEDTLLRRTDRVVAVSAWIGDWARSRGAHDVHVVPNGSSLVPPDVPVAPGLRLVHHGSLRPWHGVHLLPAVLDRLPEATLDVLGGDAPAHPRIRRWPHLDPAPLAAHLAGAHVGLVPYPPDAPPWFDPLKLHDYRAIGLPTVGSMHPAAASCDLRAPITEPDTWAVAIRSARELPRRPVARPWSQVAREALADLL